MTFFLNEHQRMEEFVELAGGKVDGPEAITARNQNLGELFKKSLAE